MISLQWLFRFCRAMTLGTILAIVMILNIGVGEVRSSSLIPQSFEQGSQILITNSTETLTRKIEVERQENISIVAEKPKDKSLLGLIVKGFEDQGQRILIRGDQKPQNKVKEKAEKIKNQNLHPAWLTFKSRK